MRFFLLAIIAAGLLLRLYNLGGESLSWDEGYSLRWASMPIAEMIAETQREDFNPPLYYALLHFAIALLGSSEVALRLLSAIAGTGAIAVLFLLGRELRSPRAGLFAAALFALAAYQLRYAQDARCFALLIFLTGSSLYAWLSNRPVWAAIAAVLAAYTHVYGLFAPALLGIGWLLRDRAERRRLLPIAALTALALIPLIYFAIDRAAAVHEAFWIQRRPTLRMLLDAFHQYTDSWALLGVLGLSGAIGCFVERKGRVLLLALLVLPQLVPYVLSQLIAPMYQPRYAMVSVLPLYLWAAIGLDFLFAESRRRTAYLFAAALLALSAWKIGVYFQESMNADPARPAVLGRSPKSPWREAAAYLDQHAEPGDLFVYNGHSGGGANVIRHYRARDDQREAFLPLVFKRADAATGEALKTAVHGSRRVWMVLYWPDDPQRILENTLRSERYEMNATPFNGERGIRLELWTRPEDARPM